ncbi:uncharacterized protein [Typha latifolia]|uniref:uncharacterized protein n=1 Tax=Typha latifolia TaxID=4733 RepID=UPI003C2F0D9F
MFHSSSSSYSDYALHLNETIHGYSDADLSFPYRHTSSPPSYHLQSNPLFSSSSSSPSSSSCDSNSDPVRGVFSSGDLLQSTNTLPASSERATRYNAEERKERIERYRSKRIQRNFHRKITYACRKTLADSRPRVKGRFARNGEGEGEAAESGGGVNGGGYDEWCWQMQEEENLWANFADVVSMNLLS